AGGQEEQPCEVKSSTTGGRVSAAAGDMTTSAPSHNSAVTCAVRCNDTIPSRCRRSRRWEDRAELSDHICVQDLDAGGTPAVRSLGLFDKAGEQAVDLA